jgi:hypothetical protein
MIRPAMTVPVKSSGTDSSGSWKMRTRCEREIARRSWPKEDVEVFLDGNILFTFSWKDTRSAIRGALLKLRE